MPVPLVRLPSLDLVKGFVAVGRRMSITQAADDLCVTQSAMSKQVRALEDALGVKLLHRGYRSVSFTEEGQRLFHSANAAVQQMQDTLDAFGTGGRRPVTITASIGVAGLWLLPRLGDFQRRHPEIDVRVAASNNILNLPSEQIDLAIRYCAEAQAPRGAARLFGETIAPVASPALGLRALDSEKALARTVLLEFEDRRHWLQWNEWLAASGWTTRQAKGILRFNQYDQVIHAAIAGQGVALGRLQLLAPMLEDRRLSILRTTGELPASHFAYWLLQADPAPRRDVAKVAEWIRAEAQAAEPAVAQAA